jgi:hypothetical protein
MAVKFENLEPENQRKYLAKAKVAWDILVTYAPKGTTDSYESFGNKIGVGKYQVGSYVLYRIREYCIEHNLPLLNCLIIRADGRLGEKWTKDQEHDFAQKLEEVRVFDWSKVKNPF